MMRKFLFSVLTAFLWISCTDSVSFFYNGEKAESSVYEISIAKDTVFNIFSFLSARGEDEEDLTGKIELVSGALDTGTAGRYTLRYRIAYKRTVKEIEIVIFVRDDPVYPTASLPVIYPKGDNPLSVPGSSTEAFTDPGAAVIDSNGRQMPDKFLSKTAYYFDLDGNRFTEVDAVLSKGHGVYRIDYNGFDYSGKAAKTVSRFVFYGNLSTRSVRIELNRYPSGDLISDVTPEDRTLYIEAGVGKTYRECGGTVKFTENNIPRIETWTDNINEIPGLYRTEVPSFDAPGNYSVYYWYSKDGTAASIEAFTDRTMLLVDKQPPVLTLGNPAADAPLTAAETWEEAFAFSADETSGLNAGQKFVEPTDKEGRFPKIEDNCDKDLLWSRVQTSFYRYNEERKDAEPISFFPDPSARRGDIYFIRYSAADRSGNLCHYWRKIEMKSGTPAQLKFYSGEKETKSVVYGYYSHSGLKSFLPTVRVVDGNGIPLPESDYEVKVTGTPIAGGAVVSIDYNDGQDLEMRLVAAGLLDLTTPGQYALDFVVTYDELKTSVKRYVSVFNYDGITVSSEKSDDDFSGEKYSLRWQDTQKEMGYSNAMVLFRSPYRSGKEWTRVGLVGESEFISVPYGVSFYKLVPARIGDEGEVIANPNDAPESVIIQLCRDFPVVEGFSASAREYSDRIKLEWKQTENADYYEIYWSRNPSFPLQKENFLAEVRDSCSYTVWEGRPNKTAYMWYFRIRSVTDKKERGWKTDVSDVRGDLIYSTAAAGAAGMREISDAEWLRDVLIEIGELQSRFNLGDGSFGTGGKVSIDGGGPAFYYRVYHREWPENDLFTDRSTLLDYFHFNEDGRRLKLSGGIAYFYLFTKSKKDYYVGITAKADSASFPEKLKRQGVMTVKGDYPGTVDIHGLLDNCWDRAASNSNSAVQNSAGETFAFRGNRWIADCDGRTSVGHSCPSYRFYQSEWRNVLGFYENGNATFAHRSKMFTYTRDGGTEKTHGVIIVP